MVHSQQNYFKNKPRSEKFTIVSPAVLRKVLTGELSSQSLSNLNKKNDANLGQYSNILKQPIPQLSESSGQAESHKVMRDYRTVGKKVKFEKPKVSGWGKILKFPFANKDINVAPEQLKITIERIYELAEEDEEDEYGEVVNPTEYAIQTAIELVSKAAKSIPNEFFKAWVSSEDTGGIRLTWSKPELKKQVRLIIPPTADQQIYLYHEKNDEYGMEYNIAAKTLGNWLRRLSSKK